MTTIADDARGDQALVARVIAGDEAAFGSLIHRYEARLVRYATYLLHDEPMAHDAVQEAFIKTYQNLRSYNKKYKFSSWIYRIVHNEAMNLVKRQRHEVTEFDETRLDELHAHESSVVQEIDKNILSEALSSCLEELDTRLREVLMLQYYEQMKYIEIADVLHVPVSTVGVWSSRAKARLRKLCEQKGVTR